MKFGHLISILLASILLIPCTAIAAVDIDKVTADLPIANSRLGASASIDGGTLVVGAPSANAAYVFVRSGANLWVQQAKLVPADGVINGFGSSVALHGNTIIVGAPSDPHAGMQSGSAYVFTRDIGGSTWAQEAKLIPSVPQASERFGDAVAVHDDTAVVGTDTFNIPGAAYVFIRDGTWSEQQKLTPPIDSPNFGSAVAVHGDLALVGDPLDGEAGDEAGAIYAFARANAVWSIDQKISANDADPFDHFGVSVALSDTTAVVGAVLDSDNGFDSGSAYVFVRDQSGWDQQQKLLPGDGGGIRQRYGISVGVDGDTAVVAALNDQVAGASTKTFLYIYGRDVQDWNELEKLVLDSGSFIASHAEFVGVGRCVAVTGTELDDDGGIDAGAAYAALLTDCPCEKPFEGLVGWWPLDDSSSPATDTQGDNDGIWQDDPTPIVGIVDDALLFDGHGDFVEVPDNPILNFGTDGSFTIDVWIRPDQSHILAGIVDKRRADTGQGYSLRLENGRPAFVMGDGTAIATSIVAPDLLPPGEWSFVAVSIDRSTDQGVLYVNGATVATFAVSTLATGNIDTSQPLRIASTETDDFYVGAIDEVELFQRALSIAELDVLFVALSGGKCKPCIEPPEGLLAWWPLDEREGPSVEDIVGPNEGEHIGTPSPANGKVDRALQIEAPGQHVLVGDTDTLDFANDISFSIDAWIRPKVVDNLISVIVQKWDPNQRVGYRLFMRSGFLIFAMSDGSGGQLSYISPNVISTTRWSLVAVTIDRANDEGLVYINGVLDTTNGVPDGRFVPSDTASGSISNDAPLFIGGNREGEALFGRIDEVEIFKVTLPLDDIRQLYLAEARGKCKPAAEDP